MKNFNMHSFVLSLSILF